MVVIPLLGVKMMCPQRLEDNTYKKRKEINLVSRNQLFKTKPAYKLKSLWQIHNLFSLYMIKYELIQCFAKFHEKYLLLGLILTKIFFVKIDFVFNNQIKNIGQNQRQKLRFFCESLHTAV